MKVAVIGASGRTGHLLVEELLRRGHQVTALARDPANLGDLEEHLYPRLAPFVGEGR